MHHKSSRSRRHLGQVSLRVNLRCERGTAFGATGRHGDGKRTPRLLIVVFYPFASGAGGKRRPGFVVQNDADNSRMAATIVAQITTNHARAGVPSHLFIEASTKEGQRSGLRHDSLVSCNTPRP